MGLTGYILAGGKSTRMGTDKGLLQLHDKSFVAHVYNALQPICDEVIIVANHQAYGQLPYKTVADRIPDMGPVGGIFTALSHTTTNTNLIVSVDSPLVSTDLLRWLVNCHKQPYLMTQPICLDKTYPLVAVYEAAARSAFEEAIKTDTLKLQSVVKTLVHLTVKVPSVWENHLKNINTYSEFLTLS